MDGQNLCFDWNKKIIYLLNWTNFKGQLKKKNVDLSVSFPTRQLDI